MSKLNQVIAIEKTVKNKIIQDLDVIDKNFQKPALFDGFTKQYKKRDDASEDVPDQKQNVQVKAREALELVSERIAKLFDITAQKDYANTKAKASVSIDGTVLIADAPATFLLFLEKQLTDLHTLIARMPVLDPAEVWTPDSASKLFRSEMTVTSRTKKVQKALVMYVATDKHPAQTQLITEDETVGTWNLTKLSGAVPEGDRKLLLKKIERLQTAVKEAREEANTVEAPAQDAGSKITEWLFA